MGSLVAELAEKLSSATNNFDIDEGTIYVNTSADTVAIGGTSPDGKFSIHQSASADILNLYDGTDVVFTVLDGGNVGIGTTVVASIAGWGKCLEIYDADGADLILNHSDASSTQGLGQLSFARDNAVLASVNGVTGSTTAKGDLNFRTNDGTGNATKMMIDEDGKVGIGTTAPDYNFSVTDGGTDTQTIVDITAFNDQTGYPPDLTLRKSHNDTIGTKTATTDNTILGRIIFNGVDSGGNFDWGAYIQGTQDGAASNQIPAELSFYTSDGGGIYERIIIKKDGKVGIGTSSPTSQLEIVNTSYTSSVIGGKLRHGVTFQIEESAQNPSTVVAYSTIDKAVTFGLQRNKNSGTYNDAWTMGLPEDSKNFQISKDTLGAAVTVDTSGKVGIGTTAPSTLLELTATDPVLTMTVGGTSNDAKIDFNNGTSVDGGITYDHNSSYASEKLVFRVGNNTSQVYITGNGFVGIGSSSPSNQVDIGHPTGPALRFTRTDSTIVADESIGTIEFGGDDPSSGATGARIRAYAQGTWASSDYASYLMFQVTPASSGSPTERLRIHSEIEMFVPFIQNIATHQKIRQFYYSNTSMANGATVDLFRNTDAYTDVNGLMWLEALHSGRTHRTYIFTLGGYGFNHTSGGDGGFSVQANSGGYPSATNALQLNNNTGYTAQVYIAGFLFGDAGVTNINATIYD